MYISLYIECPIEGQVFTECGTACPPTCSKPQPGVCTLPCVIGCQCPSGTVLDEVQNKCVKRNKCGKITCMHALLQIIIAVIFSLSTNLFS